MPQQFRLSLYLATQHACEKLPGHSESYQGLGRYVPWCSDAIEITFLQNFESVTSSLMLIMMLPLFCLAIGDHSPSNLLC